MRIAYIAAGAAGSYCGSCTRDVVLVRGLMERGHDAVLVPLYTPLTTDHPEVVHPETFYGGVNVYLQERLGLFRCTPRWLDWTFDRPWLLRAAARFAVKTRPEELGAMTVSVLRGTKGHQRKELDRLLGFLASTPRPSVVHLTNTLLCAVASEIRRRLGAPVVANLAGEEQFIAHLPEPHRGEATELLRRHAASVDVFIAPGESHAAAMSKWLDVELERIRVVRCGVEVERYAHISPRVQHPFRIGYLAQVTPVKGISILAEAFCWMALRCPGAELVVAGQLPAVARPAWQSILARARKHGLEGRVRYIGILDPQEKVVFLRGCSAFCVPVREPEPRLVAAIEAMASGVPVVGPAHGLYPELVGLTGGGMLVPVGDVDALGEALRKLYDNPEMGNALGRRAAEGVAQHFSAGAMVEQTIGLYDAL